MPTPEERKIPMMVEIFYDPRFEVGDIEVGHREFCLELLQNAGYHCVAGGVGSNSATVEDLDREARYDAIGIPSTAEANATRFITGPNPAIEPGVGIWTTAQ